MVTKKQVLEKLKEVYDPEMPINVVELGFIREIKIKDDKVEIKMTLTNPFCPMHRMITEEIKGSIEKIKDVKEVEVELVFDPPWSPDDISKEAKKKLGVE